MAQNNQIPRRPRHPGRLHSQRAYLNRVALERIIDIYYTEDDQDRLGLHGVTDLRQRLDLMRDQLEHRACDANPHLAEALRDTQTPGPSVDVVSVAHFNAFESGRGRDH